MRLLYFLPDIILILFLSKSADVGTITQLLFGHHEVLLRHFFVEILPVLLLTALGIVLPRVVAGVDQVMLPHLRDFMNVNILI